MNTRTRTASRVTTRGLKSRFLALLGATFFLVSSNRALAAGVEGFQPVPHGGTHAGLLPMGAHPHPGVVPSVPTSLPSILTIDSSVLQKVTSHLFVLEPGASLTGSYQIPRGITIVDKAGTLTLSGDLVNSGRLLVVGDRANSTGSVSAKDIFNTASGAISSIIPASLQTLAGSSQKLSLSLSALDNILNNGVISSSGGLSLTAGKSIFNTGKAASITANNDVNLTVGSGSLYNTSTITSSTGNINIASSILPSDLTVYNAGGVLSALNGAINLRDSSYSGTGNIDFYGGNLFSQTLNLYSGTGVVNFDADQVTGLVNVYSGGAHVGASTPNLNFGVLCTTGDPTYYNVGSGNSISLASIANTSGADLAVLAGGDVTISGGSLSTTQASGNGGNLLIVAGANITAPTSGTGLPDTASTTVTFNGGSTSGGEINLTSTTGINTTGTTSGNGGNVTLVAYSGTGTGTPGVITGVPAITTGGAGAGSTNGNVTMIAGATSGTTISTSTIDTTGSNAGSGSILLATATPSISGSGSISVVDGTVQTASSGSFTLGTAQPASISTGNLNLNNADLSLLSGGNGATVTTGTLPATIHNYSRSETNVNPSANVSVNGSVSFLATTDVIVGHNITAPGGISLIAEQHVRETASGLTLSTSTSGNAGNITMVAGANFSNDGSTITVTGSSTAGGTVDFSGAGAFTAIDTHSTSGGTGGTITIVGLRGNTADGGMAFNGPMTTGGSDTTHANGDVNIVSNNTAGTPIIYQTSHIDTHGGTSGTGNVDIENSTPDFTTPPQITESSAKVTSGSFTGGSIQTRDVDLNGMTVIADGSKVTLKAGGNLFMPTIDNGGAGAVPDVRASAAIGSVTNNGVIKANSVVLTAGTDVIVQSNVTAPAGITLVAGQRVRESAGSLTLSTSTSGNAGNITMVGGANFSDDGTNITINGASTAGGTVDFVAAGAFAGIDTHSTGGGTGGTITMVGLRGSTWDGGMAFNGPMTTGGAAAANGNVILVSNNNTGTPITYQTSHIDTHGGTPGTGNVNIEDSQPDFTTAPQITEASGKVNTGSFTGGVVQSRDLDLNGMTVIADGSKVTLKAGGNLFMPAINGGTGAAPDIRASAAIGSVTNNGVISANSVVLTAGTDVIVQSNISAPVGITLVAGQRIRETAANLTLSTSTSGNAGNITMVAGANFSDDGTTITINGASTPGGVIDFASAGAFTGIDTHSTSGGTGGTINMVALRGSSWDGGMSFNGPMTTGGNGAANGDVVLVSNNTTGTPITYQSSHIDTHGGTPGTGSVDIEDSQPDFTTPPQITEATGKVAVGSFTGGVVQTRDLDLNGMTVITDGANVTLKAGGNLFMPAINGGTGTAPDVRASAAIGSVTNNGVISANSVVLTAGTDVIVQSNISAPAGIALIAGQRIREGAGGLTVSTSTSGNAGNITMVAGANFSDDGSIITINSASTPGGVIDFASAGAFNGIDTHSTSGGAGGTITMVALRGSTWDGGMSFDGPMTTGGNGTNANGNVNIVSDNTTGTPITYNSGSIDTHGGTSSTGNVDIENSLPNFTTAPQITEVSGAVTTGSFTGGTIQTKDVNLNGMTITADGSTVTLIAGRTLNLPTINGGTGSAPDVRGYSGGDTNLSADLTVNSIALVAQGNININHNIVAPAGMTLIAGQNIASTAANVLLSTASATGSAANMTLVAGAAFTNNASNIVITGASSTGGDIDFNAAGAISGLNASSTGGGGSGGQLNLASFVGTNNTGYISVHGPITAGGNGSGNNGAVNIISGDENGSGTAVFLNGSINDVGGATTTGAVEIHNTVPNVSTTNVVVDKGTAALTTGTFLGGSLGNRNIDVSNTAITADGINVRLEAGGTTTLGAISASGSPITIQSSAGGDTNFASALSAAWISIVSAGNINVSHNLTATNDLLLVAGGNIGTNAGSVNLTTNSTTGNAGNIEVVAGAAYTESAGSVTINGSSSAGGNIDFSSNPLTSLNSSSTVGTGGQITLVAMKGSINGGSVSTNTTITTGGSGAANANGDFTVVSGATSGTAINLNGTVNTTGGQSGTGAIELHNTTPTAGTSIAQSSGTITGSFLGGTVGGGSVSFNKLTGDGITLHLEAGGSMTLNTIANSGANVSLQSSAGGGTTQNVDLTAGLNYVSIASGGSISVRNITAPNGISLISGQNIDWNNFGITLNTSSTTANGGNITLVAGAAFTPGADPISITGASGTGGYIFASQQVTLNTSSSAAGQAGGNVTLAAFNGTNVGASTGSINMAGITTGGGTGGTNGNVTITSGANNNQTTNIGNINTTGGNNATGTVTIETTAPVATSGSPVTVARATAAVTGSFSGGAETASSLGIGNITADGVAITLDTGNSIAFGSVQKNVGTLPTLTVNATSGSINANSTISASSVIMTSGTGITTSGLINAPLGIQLISNGSIIINSLTSPAGILIVSGHDVGWQNFGLTLDTSSTTGAAGNITVVAGAAFTQDASSVTIDQASGTGGHIDFSQVNTLDAHSSFATGHGGTISLTAFNGTDNSGNINSGSNLKTGGGTGGNNGDVLIVAGANNNQTTNVGTIDTTGGNSTSGNIDIHTATPNASTSSPVTISKTTFAAGSFVGGSLTNGGLGIGTLTADGSKISIESGLSLGLPLIGPQSGGAVPSLRATSGGTMTLNGDLNLSSVSLIAADSISVRNITAPGGILLVSGHNIDWGTFGINLNASSTTTNGGNITVIAGAAFNFPDANSVKITGASGTGGYIFAGQQVTLNTSSSAAGQAGGDVTLAAFNGTNVGATLGSINTSTITTGGNGTGNNGNVTITSGANNNQTTNIGNINTTGGNNATGTVTIETTAPVATSGSPVTVARATAAVTGSFSGGAETASSLGIGNITADGVAITLDAGNSIAFGSVQKNVGSLPTLTVNATSGSINANSTISASSVIMTSGTGITTSGLINAPLGIQLVSNGSIVINSLTSPAGILIVSGHDVGWQNFGLTLDTSSTTGAAGNITVVAGAAFTQDASSVTIDQASGTGGHIDFSQVNTLDAHSSFATGHGGTISLTAFNGSDNSGNINSGSNLKTGGGTGGNNGDVLIVAGANNNQTTNVGTIDTTGGNSTSGNIDIHTATPNASTSSPVTISKTTFAAGSFVGGSLTNGGLGIGTLTADGSKISIESGLSLGLPVIGPQSGGAVPSLRATSGGTMTLNGDLNLSSVSLIAADSINIRNITAPGGILLVSGHNIDWGTFGINLNASSTTTNGGNITVIAGAAFNFPDANSVKITGASATGGYIFAGQQVTLNTSSSATGQAGGDVTLAAFNGTNVGATLGSINTSTITTGGNGTGNNGKVTITAGANNNQTTNIGNINTTGGNDGTGAVIIETTSPVTGTGVTVANGTAAVTGSFRGGAETASSLNIGNITADGVAITLDAGNSVTFGSVQKNVGTLPTLTVNATSGSINANSTISASSVLMTSGTGITTSGLINAPLGIQLISNGSITINSLTSPGGILIVSGHDVGWQNFGLTISTASTTGNAGNLTVIAGATFTQDASTVTISGASSTGGRIDFSQMTSLDTHSTVGNGGNVTLATFTGSNNTATINIPAITSGGNGAGTNGNVTIVAGGTSGTSITTSTINTTGGASGTGSIDLEAATPNTSLSVVASKSNAAVTAGSFSGGTVQPASIQTSDLTTTGADVTVISGQNVSLGNLSANAGAVGGGGTISVTGNGTFNVGTLSANGGTTSGDGGKILLSNTNGLTTGTINPITVVNGNGGTLSLDAGTGTLTLAPGTVSVNGVGTNMNGGSIILKGAALVISPAGALVFSADATGTGTGGTVSVTTTNGALATPTGNLVIGNGSGMVTASVNGTGGKATFVSGGGLTVDSTSTLSADTVTLTANTTSGLGISLSGPVNGTTAVNLTSTGAASIGGSGLVSGGTLFLNAGTGDSALNTNVAAVTLGTNGNVTITQPSGDITLNAGTAGNGSLSVNTSAGSGNIVVGGTVVANGGFILTTATTGTISGSGSLSTTGNLSLNGGSGSITVATNAPTLDASLTGALGVTETGSVSLGNVSAGSFTLTATGGIDQQTSTNISASTLSLSAGISIGSAATVVVDANNITLVASNGLVHVKDTATTVNFQNASSATTTFTFNATGLTGSNNLTSSAGATITADTISLTSANGFALGAALVPTTSLALTAGTSSNINNADFTGGLSADTIVLSAGGSIGNTGSLVVTANNLTANATTGLVDITDNAGSVTVNGASGAATSFTLAAQSLTGTNNLVTSAAIGAQSIFLTSNNGFSFGGPLSGPTAISLTAGTDISAGLFSGAVSTASLTLTTTNGAIGTAGTPFPTTNGSSVESITAHATGDIFIDAQGTGGVTLGAITGKSFNMTAVGPVSTTADLTFLSGFNVTNPTSSMTFTNSHNITASDITISANTNLTIVGGGNSLTATTGTINLTASTGKLTVSGANATQTLHGVAELNALTGSVVIDNNTTVNGDSLVSVNSPLLTENTGAVITGNPLRIASPTGHAAIVNATGDVTLSSPMVFAGQNLAIIAEGNVKATSTLTTINLSSTTAAGGSLTIIAGYDFTNPSSGVYTIGNPSPQGGSILLPKVSINTSSTATGKAGGDITLIAHSGTANNGSIFVSALKASASLTGGVGGRITVIGNGGIQTGAVDNHAATGDSVVLAGSLPTINSGTVTITNSLLGGTGLFFESLPTASSGAGILVNGTINSSSTVGRGGDVTLLADSQISTTGVTATGANAPNALVTSAGGNVIIDSNEGSISVGATGVNSSGILNKNTAGGQAGFISINAPESITITGKVTAKGGTSTKDGGKGGSVDIETSNLNSNWVGLISITGAVDVSGGAGVVTKGGNGGQAGTVTLKAGAVKVLATGVSINAAGGKGVAAGGAGTVTIETSATQQLPANMDLTSTTKNIAAIPGAMFTVGIAAPLNGVAGTINAATIVNKAGVTTSGQAAGTIISTNTPAGLVGSGVTITIDGGPSASITESGTSTPISVANLATGVRTLVTPSEAVGLYQVSRYGTPAQTIVLSGGVAQGSSLITVNATELPAAFTAFKLTAAGGTASSIEMDINGDRPVLTLPATTVLNGTLFFSGASPMIDFGAGANLVNTGGTIKALGNDLMLTGTGATWNVNGTISANNILIARTTAGPLTFNLGGTGVLTPGGALELSPNFNAGMSLTVKANKADVLPVKFVQQTIPTVYTKVATTYATNSNKLLPVSLTFSLMNSAGTAGTGIVEGSVSGTTVSVKTTAITVNKVAVKPALDIEGTLNASTTATLSSVGSMLIAGTITAGTTITASNTDKTSGITLNGATLTSTTNTTITSAGTLALDGSTLTAGVLKSTAAPNGLLAPTDIVKSGTLALVANGAISFANSGSTGNTLVANGGNLTVTAKSTLPATSDINLDQNNKFQSNGGRVIILGTGNVTAAATPTVANSFYARSTTAATSLSGGVEIGAGTTTSTLTTAFSKPKGTAPNPNNTGATINNQNSSSQSVGVVLVNPNASAPVTLTGGTIDVSKGGAVSLDTLNGKTVTIPGATVTTESVKLVSSTSDQQPEEVVVDTDDDANVGGLLTVNF